MATTLQKLIDPLTDEEINPDARPYGATVIDHGPSGWMRWCTDFYPWGPYGRGRHVPGSGAYDNASPGKLARILNDLAEDGQTEERIEEWMLPLIEHEQERLAALRARSA